MTLTPLHACRLAIVAAFLAPTLHAASTIRFSTVNQRIIESAGEVLLSVWRLGDTDGTVTFECPITYASRFGENAQRSQHTRW